MLTLSFAVVESFRFSFCMVFRTPRNVKPVKLKLQFSVFLSVCDLQCNSLFLVSCVSKVKPFAQQSQHLSKVKPLGSVVL